MQLCSTHSTQTLLHLSFIENPPKYFPMVSNMVQNITFLEIPVIATTRLYNLVKQRKAENHQNGRAGSIECTVKSLSDGQNSCQLIS